MMDTAKKNLLYEGKAKKIFATDDPHKVIQEFKDSLTAFNAQKKGSFKGKGEINLQITTLLFSLLKKNGVPSHFVSRLNDRDMLVEKVKIIPLEVVVRNVIAGSMAARLGLVEGTPLKTPLVEFYYKNDALNDPLVTEEHALILGAATPDDLKELKKQALEINRVLSAFFLEIGVKLIDFKVEFGVSSSGKILLADEISPDSCRLWDVKTNEKLDKDRFRRDLGKVEESYRLICDKIVERLGSK